MKHRTFHQAAGTLFTIVFLVHLFRVIQGWDFVVAGEAVPMWLSWVAFIVTGLLAWTSFKFARGK